MKQILLLLTLLLSFVSPTFAADDVALPAIGGYDPVSYFTEGKAVRGSGFNTAQFEGQSYLFSTKENVATFKANPAKYAPQFGGWCAYGASLGKKFYVDPTVFEVVDGKLYLNLDGEIQKKWNADKANNIKLGHEKWAGIKSASASSL